MLSFIRYRIQKMDRWMIILVIAIVGITISSTIRGYKSARPNGTQHQNSENDMISRARPAASQIEGESLQAFITAYNALILDKKISEDEKIPEKELQHYSVNVYQDPMIYRLRFIAKQLPSEASQEGRFKKNVTYWISKATGRVTRSVTE